MQSKRANEQVRDSRKRMNEDYWSCIKAKKIERAINTGAWHHTLNSL